MTHSLELFGRAAQVLPGGVTGAGRRTGRQPVVFGSGQGKYLRDVDGRQYLDYHGALGAAILGYAHPVVDAAAIRAIRATGALLGLPHPFEIQLAERLCSVIPYAQMATLCGGGGSDAIYHAIRVSRAATGRTKVVRVEGGYHGWHSDIAVSSRPPAQQRPADELPRPVSDSIGSLREVTEKVIVVSVNDGAELRMAFEAHGSEIAAMIVEPVLFSAGCIVVDATYLRLARELCTTHGAILIFDELLTGFRTSLGGASGFSGVAPDLGVFGKAMSNGYPMSALVGRGDLIERFTPSGNVYYAGTFNGHPVSTAAALATIDVLESESVPPRIAALGNRLATTVNRAIDEMRLEAVCATFGSIWSLYFGTREVTRYDDLVLNGDSADLYEELHTFLLQHGVFIQRRYVPRCAVSAAHDEGDIDRTAGILVDFLAQHAARLRAA